MSGLLGVGLFVLLLLMGVPILFVLGWVCYIYFLGNGMPPLMIMQRMFVGLDEFVILAVPMFILAGKLMSAGGTLGRLIKFSRVLVGHLRGGLAHVNVVASMFFAGITGAATADVSALGPLEIEMMTRGGYKKDFATAVTISSSIIGPIIPPSLPLVVYGVVASTSIGGLFLAGIIPGIIMGLGLMILIYFMAVKLDIPKSPRAGIKVIAVSFVEALGPIGLPVMILIGIYGGFFTPTEAAASASLYAFILGKFVYKELKWKDIPGVLLHSGLITAASLSILSMSNVLSWVFSVELLPVKLAGFLTSVTENKFLLLLMINFGLLALGCVMETLASIMITAPIFLPIIIQLGMDPIQFGIILAINLTLGLLTPPLGLNLFIASAITGLKVDRIAYVTLPFLVVLFLVVLLVTYIPALSLFLPRVFMGIGG